jgi:hypothetical protein
MANLPPTPENFTSRFNLALLACLVFALQTAFAQGLSKKCVDELVAAKAKSKDLGSFSKDLGIEVVKVKAQMKLPFGKPKDDKVTDIGMTVGCLKTFPETPDGILATLKSAGLSAATGAAADTSWTALQLECRKKSLPSRLASAKRQGMGYAD